MTVGDTPAYQRMHRSPDQRLVCRELLVRLRKLTNEVDRRRQTGQADSFCA